MNLWHLGSYMNTNLELQHTISKIYMSVVTCYFYQLVLDFIVLTDFPDTQTPYKRSLNDRSCCLPIIYIQMMNIYIQAQPMPFLSVIIIHVSMSGIQTRW